MTEPITNNYDEMVGGATRAQSDLSTPTPGSRPAAGVDPRLTAAVDDAVAQNRRGRDKVRDGAEKTGSYSKGMSALQEEGGRSVRAAGGPQMPAMPTVPASAAPAPQPAYAPAPMAAPAPMPAPSIPAPPPPGVTSISPALLAALVAATQERVQANAAAGVIPGLTGDAASPRSASSPQAPQPLHPSQVSFERYPGGQLSPQQTAAVIDQALTINGVPNDPNLRAQWQQLYQHMAEGESARNPNAVNTSDSNATGARQADGAPANSSRGIWQCIPTTFAAYHMAGTSTSIYDPVASAAASINYVMNRYHVAPTGEGLAAFAAARGVGRGTYTGY